MPKAKSAKGLVSLRGKRVLVRARLNVPMKNGVIKNDYRLIRFLPTLKWLKEEGAKTILISHLSKPGTLKPVARYFAKHIRAGFLPHNGKLARTKLLDSMSNGSVFVMEDIRRKKGEKENSKELARDLASMADLYINDDFSVSHRKHASVEAITHELPSYIGPLFEDEIKNLSLVFKTKKLCEFHSGVAFTLVLLIYKFRYIS